jgi:hypothetical protein
MCASIHENDIREAMDNAVRRTVDAVSDHWDDIEVCWLAEAELRGAMKAVNDLAKDSAWRVAEVRFDRKAQRVGYTLEGR